MISLYSFIGSYRFLSFVNSFDINLSINNFNLHYHNFKINIKTWAISFTSLILHDFYIHRLNYNNFLFFFNPKIISFIFVSLVYCHSFIYISITLLTIIIPLFKIFKITN